MTQLEEAGSPTSKPENRMTGEKKKKDELWAAERADGESDYACFRCFNLLPRGKFGDRQATGKRGKYSVDPCERLLRFCIDCGLKGTASNMPNARPDYLPGMDIKIQGVACIICIRCCKVEKKLVPGEKSPLPRTIQDYYHGWCEECMKPVLTKAEKAARRQARADQLTRRQAMIQESGSGAEDCWSDSIPTSATWSEMQIDLIQSERDGYCSGGS
jgi:hypothetical protein